METIKIRGLLHFSASIFGVWGAVVFLKGIYDLLGGQPEANLYAPAPWAFVTKTQWLRYAGFESIYGLTCLAVAWLLLRYARFLPETISRKRVALEMDLFR